MFTKDDYDAIHDLVFRPDYPGYKPTVTEIPNGDGKADTEKKYGHVATKYFATAEQAFYLTPYLVHAHHSAVEAAKAADIPKQFWPDLRYSALRILDYPAGAISNKHCDFDLFTLMMYRDQPGCFLADEVGESRTLDIIKKINAQAHLGELGAAIGLGPATPHQVLASAARQCSIVYFAIPDHELVLPSGQTVRDWLNERMARSRTEFRKYE